ncbi:P110/LppT family adhesin N-terminal domain [Mesomycoplasma bovoculi]|uniref:p102/LppT family protein n=1 Tax=Mesomycoplasma bovoculi M165/69 TaxID=743966 RepID=W5UUA5_9BACT|nr:P110/LppT family adhesin N-terminal domain [Mesomycoplasma bovoculi]AHH45390.1 P102/LppT family protein [Mesomycoplasma bovoculi M165/69]
MKHILVKKVSHVKAILILGTGLLVPAAAIAGGWATYNYFENKNYKSFVEFGKTEQLAGASTPLTNENFVKQMESLPLEAKYKQYSPSQIFNLVLDKKNPINLISIFDLSDFKQKYPNIKVNAYFITSDLAANNTIATAQQLENVLFTAVDNATNQIYSSVVNVSGFGEAQTTRVPVFSVDETQSKLVYKNFDLTDNILPSTLASKIQSFYTSHNQDFGQTVSNFGSLKLIDANGSNIVVPSELRLDFAKNSENQIAFDKIDDNSGSLIVSVEILDGNNKVSQFKLQITNLNSYKLALQEFTKLTSDVTNPDRNPVKLIADKQREIALSQKNLSTFFKEGQDVTDFFDFSVLKRYFKHLHPTFRAQIEQTNFQLDALGEIQVRATVDFNASSSNAQTKAENSELQSSKVTATPVQALSDLTDNLDQDDENAGQSHYFLFNFRIFNNYAQDFLNAVVENNNYFVVRPEYGYVNALDIIAKLENINVAYYAFLKNLSAPKGYGVVSLTNSSNYDSVTVQQAIVHSVEQTFDNVIDFPNWKKTVKQTVIDPSTGLALETKASKALAKIFSSLNNIINQPGLKNDKVNYNLSFDNASQQLIIGISIYNDNNERVATQNIIIAGFAPSLPALTTIKNLGSDLYFDGAALKTVDEKNKESKKVLPSLLNNNFVFEAKDNSKLEVNQVNGLSGIILDSEELTLKNNTPKPAPQSNALPGTSTSASGGGNAAQTLQAQQQVVQTQNQQPSSFGIVFSEDNSLEENKPRIILQEKPKNTQALQGTNVQSNGTNNSFALFVEKVSDISKIQGFENLKSKKITQVQSGSAWVIGFGNKDNISDLTTTSSTGGTDKKVEILAAFPIEGNENSTSKATTFVLTIDRNDGKIQVNAASFDGENTKKQNTFELDKSSSGSQATTLLGNLGKQDSNIVLGPEKSSTPTTTTFAPITSASPVPSQTTSPSSPSSNTSPTTQSTPNASKTTLHALTFYNAKQSESTDSTKPSVAPQQQTQAPSQPAVTATTPTKEVQPSAVFEALLKSYTKN